MASIEIVRLSICFTSVLSQPASLADRTSLAAAAATPSAALFDNEVAGSG